MEWNRKRWMWALECPGAQSLDLLPSSLTSMTFRPAQSPQHGCLPMTLCFTPPVTWKISYKKIWEMWSSGHGNGAWNLIPSTSLSTSYLAASKTSQLKSSPSTGQRYQSRTLKYLGVTLDAKCWFGKDVNKTATKASNLLGFFWRSLPRSSV